MADGYQVVKIKNKIKFSDMGGLNKELKDRIGTGNYDFDRTKFNITFTPFCSYDLASSTYKTLHDNKVYFNKNNKNLNLLNGCIITSGQEFFKSLGMNFEPTGNYHMSGKHIGEPMEKVVIKSNDDIPDKVLDFFRASHNFMCNLVGKENVIYSAIHFDEDTPHLHFYFTPVVHEVKRKVFETDENGHQILKPYIDKNGNEKMIPIQKKDELGKIVYEYEYGNFLNSDQFWKSKGSKQSFAKVQDKYHEYITKLGFNLDRGEIGANKEHLTKAEKQLQDLQIANELLIKELDKNKQLNNVELSYKDKISDVDNNPLLNPEKGKLLGYKEADVINLSNYSKEITKDNLIKEKELKQKEIELTSSKKKIDKLNTEIKNLKSSKTLKDKDIIINNQKEIIKEKDKTIEFQNNIISSLRSEIDELKETIDYIVNKVKNVAIGLFKALKRTLGFEVDKYQKYDEHSFKQLSNHINKKYEKNNKDDFEL